MRALLRPTEPDGQPVGEAHPWRLVEPLGSGGMAEVWRAVDAAGNEAALKRLRPELRADTRACALLRGEYRWLDELRCPAFVTPLDLTQHEGALALVLEYLPGGDLVPLLGGPLGHWLAPLQSVIEAVARLHGRGLAHCDLKARNVLFGADGSPRLIDFASVRPLDAAAPLTTRACRAASGAVPPTAGDADCFALAALLFELLTGRSPYGAAGQARVGEVPLAEPLPERGAAALLAAACAELARGGRGGLPPLRDVIESVGAVTANNRA